MSASEYGVFRNLRPRDILVLESAEARYECQYLHHNNGQGIYISDFTLLDDNGDRVHASNEIAEMSLVNLEKKYDVRVRRKIGGRLTIAIAPDSFDADYETFESTHYGHPRPLRE